MEIVDMAWTLFSGIIGVVTGAWVAKRWLFSERNIMESVDSVLEYLLKTEEGQKKIYSVAGLVGKGIRDGIGIKGIGGKRKIEDIIVELGVQWLAPKLGLSEPQEASHKSGNSGMDIK